MDDYEHYGVLGTEPRFLQEQQDCLVISLDPWLWFYCRESEILMHFFILDPNHFYDLQAYSSYSALSGFIIVSFIV